MRSGIEERGQKGARAEGENESMHAVVAREPFDQALAVLMEATKQIRCDSDIERTVAM